MFTSCDSGAYYAIDEKPKIKIDTNLLGIWVQGSYDCYMVQTFDDVYRQVTDEFKNDSAYLFEEKNKGYLYYLTEIQDQSMETPLFVAFMSKVNKDMLANVTGFSPHKFRKMQPQKTSYIFVTLTLNKAHNEGTLTPFYDTTIQLLTSSAEVRRRFEQRGNKILRPDANVVFKKISSYHASAKEAKILAKKLRNKNIGVRSNRTDSIIDLSKPIKK